MKASPKFVNHPVLDGCGLFTHYKGRENPVQLIAVLRDGQFVSAVAREFKFDVIIRDGVESDDAQEFGFENGLPEGEEANQVAYYRETVAGAGDAGLMPVDEFVRRVVRFVQFHESCKATS